MSFFKYLKENYKLIILYAVLMIFIYTAIYIDSRSGIQTSNLLYIAMVSFFMFMMFLLIDYNEKYRYIKKLKQFETSEDKTPMLPVPKDYKDEIYSSIVEDLYNFYSNSLRDMESKFKENNEFMTAWVHEIKTPITTSKLLLDSFDGDDSSFMNSMSEEIDKIDDYVEKVLYYSRSDDFSKDYIISELNLNKIIKESVKKHSIIFIRKHINFINKVDENFFIDSDKKWIVFIINQFVSNSLKYTRVNGNIKFSVSENDNEKILILEDDGIGIKKEDINRIFTKSFTGSNGRNSNIKASGLGLYLSQKMAKKLGHYITLESEYGRGTTVCLHFPKWNDYYITKM